MKQKTYNILKITLALPFVVTCYVLYATYINAQEVDLSVSPALLDVVMQEGKTFSTIISLHNAGDDVVVSPYVRSATYIESQDSLKPLDSLDGEIALRLYNKENASDSAVMVRKNQTKQFKLSIQTPSKIENVERYYSALFVTKYPLNKTGISAQINTVVGTNIIVTVSNDGIVQIKGKIASMKIDSQARSFPANLLNAFDSTDQIPIILTIANDGKNKIRPSGNLTLKGSFGETATYPIDPQNVLAYTSRTMKIKPISGFFVGNYHISAEINLGENGPKLFSSTSFFAFPVRYLICFILIAVCGWYFIRKSEKR